MSKMNVVGYRWADGFPDRGIKAEIAAREFEAIRKKNGGTVAVSDVVEASRDTNSPLNKIVFKLSDEEAAESHRKTVARNLMDSLIVTYTKDGSDVVQECRYIVSFKAPEDGKRSADPSSYSTINVAMKSPEISGQIIERAWDELMRWKTRYDQYRELLGGELSPVFAAIDQAREKASEIKEPSAPLRGKQPRAVA